MLSFSATATSKNKKFDFNAFKMKVNKDTKKKVIKYTEDLDKGVRKYQNKIDKLYLKIKKLKKSGSRKNRYKIKKYLSKINYYKRCIKWLQKSIRDKIKKVKKYARIKIQKKRRWYQRLLSKSPKAKLRINKSKCTSPCVVQLSAAKSYAYGGKSIKKYIFYTGDGKKIESETPVIQYTYYYSKNNKKKYQTFRPRLRVIDSYNRKSRLHKRRLRVKKGNELKPLDVSISTDVTSGKTPLTTLIKAISNDSTQEIHSYIWKVSGNLLADQTSSISHQFLKSGDYIINLEVSNSKGQKGSAQKIIKVLAGELLLPELQKFTTQEDQPLVFTLGGAINPEGTNITYTSIGDVIGGKLTGCLNATASLNCTFTPEENFNGKASFSFIANDSVRDSAKSSKVEINITPVNDLPTLASEFKVDFLSSNSNMRFSLPAGLDIDNQATDLIYEIVGEVTNGSLENCLNKSTNLNCLFVPSAGFTGITSFQYRAFDKEGGSNISNVSIEITQDQDTTPPVASFSPETGHQFLEGEKTINISLSDIGSGVDYSSIKLFVNNVFVKKDLYNLDNVQSLVEIEIKPEMRLLFGENIFHIQLSDIDGNTSNFTASYHIQDISAPTIIETNLDNKIQTTTPLIISKYYDLSSLDYNATKIRLNNILVPDKLIQYDLLSQMIYIQTQ